MMDTNGANAAAAGAAMAGVASVPMSPSVSSSVSSSVLAPDSAGVYRYSLNRFEVKYRLHYEQAQKLVGLIAPYVRRDEYVTPQGFYRIVSLYYDSPGLIFFWEKLDGVKFRRKLRVRLYGDSPSQAFLEIKQRIDQTVQKRRVAGERGEILAYLDSTVKAPRESDNPVYAEACYLVHGLNLEPKVVVSYNREAYVGLFDRSLRVNLDRALRYSKYDGDFTFGKGNDHFMLPPHEMVLEVKFCDVVPSWLCSCLNALNLKTERISKYCLAVNQSEYRGSLLQT